MKYLHLLLFFFCAFSTFANARHTINQQVFDAVINEVAANHFDGQFRQKYAQKIAESRKNALKSVNFQQLGSTINRLLRSLPDSHLGVIAPPDKNAELFEILQSPVKLLESDGRVLVSEASLSSKFRKGDEILSVNNNSGDKFSRLCRTLQFNSILTFNRPDLNMPIEVKRDGKKVKFHHKTRKAEKMPRIFRIGEMPGIVESYHSKLLNSQTAYIAFDSFTPAAVQSLKKDISTKFKNVPKMVIDLRSNIGGLIMMGVNMASFLSSKRVDFGTMTIASQKLTPKSYPQEERYKGKIYILIGRSSCSTAEIFALAMKESNAAILIGERTSGLCLPSAFVRLPHGFRLQTVMGDYVSSQGYRIEGKGVTPDKIIKLSTQSLKKNRDDLLEWVMR